MQYTKISHMNPAERVEALTASLVSLSCPPDQKVEIVRSAKESHDFISLKSKSFGRCFGLHMKN